VLAVGVDHEPCQVDPAGVRGAEDKAPEGNRCRVMARDPIAGTSSDTSHIVR
jgi:hypothetical protein